MIVRVWGIVNSTEVEFSPVADRPGYWEGLAPRVDGLQEIEIWAENDEGARGHLQCTVQITYHTETVAAAVIIAVLYAADECDGRKVTAKEDNCKVLWM